MNKTCHDIIALSFVNGLGPRGAMKLLKEFRTVEEIFSLSSEKFSKITGLNKQIKKDLNVVRSSRKYLKELEYLKKREVKVLSYFDENYPELLKGIYDPPPLLYYKGTLLPKDVNIVAIVGSRKCSSYGLSVAEKLAYDLAKKNITIVSGMAKGIDTAAHEGAIKAGGRTIAVMGSGFNHIYPKESEGLARKIAKHGAVLTEYHSDASPRKWNFPKRNRIISGMSKGVIVVEAAFKSGALITSDFALEEGKEVFAVPGRIDFLGSIGTNSLIQNGAKLVMNSNDVIEELNLKDSSYSKEYNLTR